MHSRACLQRGEAGSAVADRKLTSFPPRRQTSTLPSAVHAARHDQPRCGTGQHVAAASKRRWERRSKGRIIRHVPSPYSAFCDALNTANAARLASWPAPPPALHPCHPAAYAGQLLHRRRPCAAALSQLYMVSAACLHACGTAVHAGAQSGHAPPVRRAPAQRDVPVPGRKRTRSAVDHAAAA